MNTLILLTKYPIPGHVKTRLAVSVWDKKACAFQKWALHKIIKEHKNRTYRLAIWLHQEDKLNRFVKDFWVSADQVFIQQWEHLGEIMDHAMNWGNEQWEKTILIWSDTVDITSQEIQQGFTDLKKTDAVLWPSNDGWYWMIWSWTHLTKIFLHMEYSHTFVFDQTTDRIQRSGKSLILGNKHIDVDTLDDLRLATETTPKIYNEIIEQLGLGKVLFPGR